MIESVVQDLVLGARMLGKNRAFAAIAIVSIAIGVGANAAMFSLADTLVLRPLTVPRAADIVTVTAVVPRSGFAPPTSAALSYPDFLDVRDQARSFADLVAYRLIVTSFASPRSALLKTRARRRSSSILSAWLKWAVTSRWQ